MVTPTPADQVVILIPTLNEAAHIAGVLDQILSEDRLAQGARVIVADGGSTDGTTEIVGDLAATRYRNLRLIDNPKRTQAHAMNMLLKPDFAGTTVAIRVDAHAQYPRDFVSRLVAELDARPGVASVVIPMDAVPTESCFRRGLAYVADTKLGAGGSPHRGGTASGYVDHGHHAAFRLETFRILGGYDTSFIANEDAEYDRRLGKSGRRIWLESSIRIGYYPRDTIAGLWKQYFRYGVGRARNCLKHGDRPALRQMIPVIHVVLLALSLLALPFTAWGWLWPVLYAGLLSAVAVAMALRHRSLCGLVALPALATMHTAWGLGFLWGAGRGRPQAAMPVRGLG
ncbi:glycosyltransferase family 2 protein [Celeribacter indicus]|uniref:Succinoglycan biosynthesis protein ExoA n=1 Tax=Celeribacter indicus TaxID=1208324 RepID=A0A0B5E331_9RHOB|nr:glycosyltransferase family 2 protein [Celeribacter indicus]AJE47795.1 succinoglycan biosynthesis protein ExoA [Celeribacter indicus]SDW23139.1 succinoglycan biosynthesis protein ExoA [Celeribacter indicus]